MHTLADTVDQLQEIANLADWVKANPDGYSEDELNWMADEATATWQAGVKVAAAEAKALMEQFAPLLQDAMQQVGTVLVDVMANFSEAIKDVDWSKLLQGAGQE